MILSDGRSTHWDRVRFEAHAERWAAQLRRREHSRIAVVAHNQLELLALFRACWQEERLLVPLPAFFTRRQIERALQVAQCDVLFTDGKVGDLQLEGWSASVCAHKEWHCRTAGRRSHRDKSLPEDVRRITFTSGTTGNPKGVCLTAETLQRTAAALHRAAAVDSSDVHLCLLPLSILLQEMAGWHVAAIAQARVIVPRDLPMTPHDLAHALQEHRPTQLLLNPALLQLLLAAVAIEPGCAASLKFVAVGSAPVSPKLLQHARSFDLPVFEGYGLSEAGSVVTLNTPARCKSGSCGREIGPASIRIDGFDADEGHGSNWGLELVATHGGVGEIVLAGSLASGIVTEEGYSPLPSELRTGDLGYVDGEGFLHFVGRCDHVFATTEGRNVAPEWIERVLQSEPAIDHAFVYGHGCRRPVAVIASTEEDMAIEIAVEHANSALPDYAQVQTWTRMQVPLHRSHGTLDLTGKPSRRNIFELHQALLPIPSPSADVSTSQ